MICCYKLFFKFWFKLYISEQEAANKIITDLKTEVQTLKRKVDAVTEEKIELSTGN